MFQETYAAFFIILSLLNNPILIIFIIISSAGITILITIIKLIKKQKVKPVLYKEAKFLGIVIIIILCAFSIQSAYMQYKLNACGAKGGHLERSTYPSAIPETLTTMCNLPTKDAGKYCTDSSQCESFCYPTDRFEVGENSSGKCYEWKINTTCPDEVKNGVVARSGCAIF